MIIIFRIHKYTGFKGQDLQPCSHNKFFEYVGDAISRSNILVYLEDELTEIFKGYCAKSRFTNRVTLELTGIEYHGHVLIAGRYYRIYALKKWQATTKFGKEDAHIIHQTERHQHKAIC